MRIHEKQQAKRCDNTLWVLSLTQEFEKFMLEQEAARQLLLACLSPEESLPLLISLHGVKSLWFDYPLVI